MFPRLQAPLCRAARPACARLLICLPFAIAACHKPQEPDYPVIQRLSVAAFEAGRAEQRTPLALPLDRSWSAREANLEVRDDVLHFAGSGRQSGLECGVEINAAEYNRLRIRMRVNAGSQCRVEWQSNLDPKRIDALELPACTAPIMPGGTYRDFVVHLDRDADLLWNGAVNRITLYPSNVAAEVEIAAVAFEYEAPLAMPRLRIGPVEMEAFFGNQPPWTVHIPPEGAWLDAHVGLHSRAWMQEITGNVRFIVDVLLPGGRRNTISLMKLTPAQVEEDKEWQPLRVNLARYAGQTIVLDLHVDELDLPLRDYAFWGNPCILPAPPERDTPVPVILISCDTLRADHVSCYGYERRTTPNLDRWAKDEAVCFENAIVADAFTLPSHMTMLTGLYPKNHGVTVASNLPEETVTLAEWLRDRGYQTAAFTGHGFWLDPKRGFGQGFDIYDSNPLVMLRHFYRTSERLLDWLGDTGRGRLFLFLHNYDIHQKSAKEGHLLPYSPGDAEFHVFSKDFLHVKPFQGGRERGMELLEAYQAGSVTLTPNDRQLLSALYDDCIRMVDAQIDEIFQQLKLRGLYDNALIIVTADHGETLDERGYYGHDDVYEETCRVPLLIRFPGAKFAGRRVSGQVELVDLFATIQEVLGFPDAVKTDGESLLALLDGRRESRPFAYVQRAANRAIRTNEWKLRWSGPPYPGKGSYELYDLNADPGEMLDVITPAPPVLEPMRTAMHEFFQVDPKGWCVRLIRGDAPRWKGALKLSSDTPITACYILSSAGEAVAHPVRADGAVAVDLGEFSNATVVVSCAASDARLGLYVEAEPDTTVRWADQTAYARPTAALTFGREDVADQPPDAAVSGPRLLVWRRAAAQSQTAAPPMTDETKEQLRALGYLDGME